LVSPAETHEHFSRPAPFSIRHGSWLPDHRIVWCDVPWKQRYEDADGEDDGVFAAPAEVRAVIDVLAELQPTDQSCEIQILSPYNDQLEAIREELKRSRGEGRLGALFTSPFDLTVGKRLGATVDEFQGSEADVVVVSLVRNNAYPPWKSVGFLREANRMNVLLSRAKQKLIVVGSWDFFATRCDERTSPDAEWAYLGLLMREAVRSQAAGHLARVSAPR
jgi:hypothetical protein